MCILDLAMGLHYSRSRPTGWLPCGVAMFRHLSVEVHLQISGKAIPGYKCHSRNPGTSIRFQQAIWMKLTNPRSESRLAKQASQNTYIISNSWETAHSRASIRAHLLGPVLGGLNRGRRICEVHGQPLESMCNTPIHVHARPMCGEVRPNHANVI